ncbi:hypothetical protein FA598_24510 [Salmonella enterica]|nr:hypothetical protein [Salmonella enterica]
MNGYNCISFEIHLKNKFEDGDWVDIELNESGLVVQKASKPRVSESGLLAGISPCMAHADEMISPSSREVDYSGRIRIV